MFPCFSYELVLSGSYYVEINPYVLALHIYQYFPFAKFNSVGDHEISHLAWLEVFPPTYSERIYSINGVYGMEDPRRTIRHRNSGVPILFSTAITRSTFDSSTV